MQPDSDMYIATFYSVCMCDFFFFVSYPQKMIPSTGQTWASIKLAELKEIKLGKKISLPMAQEEWKGQLLTGLLV